MIEVVDVVLLLLLGAAAITVIRQRNLVAAVMMAGIYSLLSAALFVVWDAVDVAFIEAVVGAGISTILLLGALALVGHDEHEPRHRPILPLFVVTVTGAILVYGTLDLPPFGDPSNPAHRHVAPHYLEESEHEIGIPNVVTSVLASYRGYDTMGETVVIFTAVVGVLVLLSRGPRPRRVLSNGQWITVAARDDDPPEIEPADGAPEVDRRADEEEPPESADG